MESILSTSLLPLRDPAGPELRRRGEGVLRWGVHVRYSVRMDVSCGSLFTPRTCGFSVCPLGEKHDQHMPADSCSTAVSYQEMAS